MSCLQNQNFPRGNAHFCRFPPFLLFAASHTGTVTSGISNCCFLEEKNGFYWSSGNSAPLHGNAILTHLMPWHWGFCGQSSLNSERHHCFHGAVGTGQTSAATGNCCLRGAWSTITPLVQAGLTARCPHSPKAGFAFQGKCRDDLWVFLAGD